MRMDLHQISRRLCIQFTAAAIVLVASADKTNRLWSQQEATDERGTLKVEVDLVNVIFTVTEEIR